MVLTRLRNARDASIIRNIRSCPVGIYWGIRTLKSAADVWRGWPRKVGVHGAETLAPKYRAEAKARADRAPLIREFQKRGYTMRGIALELEKRKVQTPRGGAWHPQLVKRIVQRLSDTQ